MKTVIYSGGVLLAGMLALSARPSGSGKTNETASSSSPTVSEGKQCGVSSDDITSYLRNCSHHHTTYWVQDISGTCNTNVGIENDEVATVYVSDGIITGHLDSPGMNPQ